MRPPPYHHKQRERLDVTMTPMIDVIFLLLIFFVCTASFQPPEEILPTRLSLPGAIDSDVPIDPDVIDLGEIVVRVLWREGRAQWLINEVNYTQLAEIRAVLLSVKRVKTDLPVILDVEPAVPMEDVIDVYDLCRAIGLETVRFAASAEE
ncbi:MAG: biopolymer transporter ExbD [Pirellulales bacterium]|nr:biopolymer transporter ExbD [Pirellulales bacterium]